MLLTSQLLHTLIVSSITIIILWMVLVLYTQKQKLRIKPLLLMTLLTGLVWVNGAFLARILAQHNYQLAEYALRSAWAATPLLFMLLYFIVREIGLLKKSNTRIITAPVMASNVICSVLIISTDFILSDFHPMNGTISIIYGSLMIPFLLVILTTIIVTIILLRKQYSNASLSEQATLQFIVYGLLIFYGSNILFNIIFPILLNNPHYYYLGDYSIIFLLGLLIQAIAERKLLNINILPQHHALLLITILMITLVLVSGSSSNYLVTGFAASMLLLLGFVVIISLQNSSQEKENLISTFTEQNKTLLKVAELAMSITEKEISIVHGIVKHAQGLTPEQQKALKKLTSTRQIVSKNQKGLFDYFTKSPIDALITQTVMSCRPFLRKNTTVEIMDRATDNTLACQQDLILYAIHNILKNACQYTQKGEILITLADSNNNSNFLIVTITDPGIGLDKNDKKIIFKPYEIGTRAVLYNPEALGISLTIAKEIINIHNGTLFIDSLGPNQGTTATITIPRMPGILTDHLNGFS